jgi:hypothetical protein
VIDSLDDAWRWYEAASTLARTTERLERYWDRLPWEGDLGRDNYLRDLTAEEIGGGSRAVLDDLNDLCVLLLFSVFEAIVRKQVLAEVDEESALLRHAAIKRAVVDMREGIENGSFFKVLEPYKISDPDLVEEVNQVRRYRNWVAHGRRSDQPDAVEPAMAYDRLKRFLAHLEGSDKPDSAGA